MFGLPLVTTRRKQQPGTPHHAKGILDAMRAHQAVVRHRRCRTSKLTCYGADIVTLHRAGVGLAASVMLGLTPCEGAALFEAKVSPNGPEEFDELEFCAGLTPDLAARALRGIADGVFSSLMWNDLQFHVGLNEWLEVVLGYNPWDGYGSMPEQGR